MCQLSEEVPSEAVLLASFEEYCASNSLNDAKIIIFFVVLLIFQKYSYICSGDRHGVMTCRQKSSQVSLPLSSSLGTNLKLEITWKKKKQKNLCN